MTKESALMAQVRKSDCISLQKARGAFGISRPTLYSYINRLHIKTHRWPLDKNSYITRDDYARIERFIETGVIEE